MPTYKQRKIELTPKRYEDGTWHGLYRIIEFRASSWGYYRGSARGVFATREAAATAALDEAKRIVDTLGPPAQAPRSERPGVLARYGKKVRRLFTKSKR